MNTYKCMYVIPEERYKILSSTQSPSTIEDSPLTLTHSPLTLAHSPLTNLRCNICKKLFGSKKSLNAHLRAHKPQAGPDADKPVARTEYPTEERLGVKLKCHICNKLMKHKRNLTRHLKLHKNSIKLHADKWETLN